MATDEKATVLFISANPEGTHWIHIDEEVREVSNALTRTSGAAHVRLVSCPAARIGDVVHQLAMTKPAVIHISAYGTKTGEIILIGDDRKAAPISADAFLVLFNQYKTCIKLVFLAACYSLETAEKAAEVVGCAIGIGECTSSQVFDFISRFYHGLSLGSSVGAAFEQAIPFVKESRDCFQLFVREGVDGNHVFPLTSNSPPSSGSRRSRRGQSRSLGADRLPSKRDIPAVFQGLRQAQGGAPYPRLSTPKTTVEAAEPTVLLSWLHLSDLHFGHPGEGWDQRLIQRELQRDFLAQRQRLFPPPQAMLVTGDIAFRGNAAEYRDAASFLQSFDLDPAQIYLVPGNHDVRRSADRQTQRLLRDLREGRLSVDEALDDAHDAALLRARLADYLTFAQGFAAHDEDGCGWTAPLDGDAGLRLRLIGLNTALLANDDQDQGKLRLGQRAVARALAAAQPEELLVVLSHHPFREGWLADQKEADGWVRRRACLHLSGHIHEADFELARSGDGSELLRVSAGAAHGEERRHGYNVAAILRGSDGVLFLRLWPRRWADKQKAFVADVDNLAEGERYADHPLRL